VTFLDPIEMFTGKDTSDMLASDRIHPNQRRELALSLTLAVSIKIEKFAPSR
jgi:hypothetical protein